ncbi:MAG: NAD(P)-dependent oxidoreductase [Halanaerobiaceae bacterium]
MKKVLVTHQLPEKGLKELKQKCELTEPDGLKFSREEVKKMLPDYDALLAVGIKVDQEIIDIGKNLGIISVYAVGYDSVDIAYAAKKGIPVTNTPDSVTGGTAELAFGLMISLMRKIILCDRKLRNDNYQWGLMTDLGTVLYGKKLGIIGMGRIGQALARRARAFEMDILYHNRNRVSPEVEEELSAEYCTREELLQRADVVSVNTPLNKETYHLIGRKELDMMNSSSFIINTARGPVIDEKTLIEKLKRKEIAGAGLDVFENEPHIPDELKEMEQTVITPHIGTQTRETRIQMAREASENIIKYFAGEKVEKIVNGVQRGQK